MGKRHDSDDNLLLIFLISIAAVIGLLVFAAVKLPQDRFNVLMSALDFIKIVLIAVAVFIFTYNLIKLVKFIMEKVQQKKDSEVIRMPLDAINNSFTCQACGASVEIKNEIHPSVSCPFCGATIQALKNAIQHRDDRYLDTYVNQVDNKIYMNQMKEAQQIQTEIAKANRKEKQKLYIHIFIPLLISLGIILLLFFLLLR